jgi:hypothetical protein
MANSFRRVDLNFAHIKRYWINLVKRSAIKNDAIIFGGAVRDEIIAEHYEKKYQAFLQEKNMKYNNNKFWDVKHHPETAARTLVADDVDIFFSSTENADIFLNSLTNVCEHEKNIDIVVDNMNTDDPSQNPRRYGHFLDVKKVTLTINVGHIPRMFHGYDIILDIDIVTPQYRVQLKPPFRNVDFLCNSFIKTNMGILLSPYTGTYLDKLTHTEKTIESAKLVQDIVSFKTYFCNFEKLRSSEPGTYKLNKHAFKRINKLLQKEPFQWTICNLPFDTRNPLTEELTEDCCICSSQFTSKDCVVITSTEKDGKKIKCSCTHKQCFMDWMIHQNEDAELEGVDNNEDFVFKCPMRTIIDFTKCSRDYVVT